MNCKQAYYREISNHRCHERGNGNLTLIAGDYRLDRRRDWQMRLHFPLLPKGTQKEAGFHLSTI